NSYDTYYDNFAHTTFQAASGWNHSTVLGEDGFVYDFGSGTLGTLGDGRAIDSAAPLRVGIREESVVVQFTGTNTDSKDAIMSNTNASRIVVDQQHPYVLNPATLKVKEYNGFNLFQPGVTVMSSLNYNTLTQVASTVSPTTLTVDIMDPSILKSYWYNGQLYFEAVHPDKFGSTTVILTYDYTDDKGTAADTSDDTTYHYVYQFVVYVKDTNRSTNNSLTVSQVATGNYHASVLRPDGTVWTWGQGTSGQLGDGASTWERKAYPVQVVAGEQANAVVCDNCGRVYDVRELAKGDIACWTCGENVHLDMSIPAVGETAAHEGNDTFGYLHDIVYLSAGGDHTLAVDRYGAVWAWGLNDRGQLGMGAELVTKNAAGQALAERDWYWRNITANQNAPVRVQMAYPNGTVPFIVAVAAGDKFSLALDDKGYVWAWGDNAQNQLGRDLYVADNATLYSAVAQRVTAGMAAGPMDYASDFNDADKTVYNYLGHVIAISAGTSTAMAVRANGQAYAWGLNTSGQTGVGYQGDSNASTGIRSYISAPTGVRADKLTENTDFAKSTTTRVVSSRNYGQNYRNDDLVQTFYRTNEFFYQVAETAIGEHHTLVLTRGNNLYAMGENKYGEMGMAVSATAANNIYTLPKLVFHGTETGTYHAATIVTLLTDDAGLPVRDINGNYVERGGTYVNAEGQSVSSGERENLDTDAGEMIVQISAGVGYSGMRAIRMAKPESAEGANDALSELSHSYAFGLNDRGQLGNGSTASSYLPARTRKGGYEEHNDDYLYLEGVYHISSGAYSMIASAVYPKTGTGYTNTNGDSDDVLDGMFGYVWGWGNNAMGVTGDSANLILGQLSNLISTYLTLPDQIGARESMELMVDYMEAVTYLTDTTKDPSAAVRAWKSDYTGHAYKAGQTGYNSQGYYGASSGTVNLTEVVPPFITLGANEHLIIYKQNTHLHYNSGFSLYPMVHDLNSVEWLNNDGKAPTPYEPVGELWAAVMSNPDIADVTVNNNAVEGKNDAVVFNRDYMADPFDYRTGRTTLTLGADYNNGPGVATAHDSGSIGYTADNWQVYNDYDSAAAHQNTQKGLYNSAGALQTGTKVNTTVQPDMVVTGQYVFSLDIDLQPSSTEIVPKTVAGQNFTAMNTVEGNVWVWGENVWGVLGQGNVGGTASVFSATLDTVVNVGMSDPSYPYDTAYSPTSVANPQKVMAYEPGTTTLKAGKYLDNIMTIAAGYDHMVALDKDGHVWTWGRNQYGQLGYETSETTTNVGGTRSTYSSVARQVVIQEPDKNGVMKDVVIMAIAAGRAHTLALSNSGEVWAWGNNKYSTDSKGQNLGGQLGRETLPEKWTEINTTPMKVLGDRGQGYLTNVVMVSAGGDTSAALKGDGTVWTWGRNDVGQLGIDRNEKPLGAPSQVLKGDSEGTGNYLTDVSTIAVGDNHMLAIQTKVVYDGTLTGDELEAAQQKVFGWGSNANYQLTHGPAKLSDDGKSVLGYEYTTTGQYFTPKIQYVAPVADETTGVYTQSHLFGIKTVEAGVNTSMAINRIDKNNLVPIDPEADPTDPATVMKYRRNAEVYAWGQGDLGQLGDGRSNVVNEVYSAANAHNVEFPQFVQDGETAEHVATGDQVDQSPYTQGYKVTEKTGNLTEAKYISLGYDHASVIRYDGYVWGWGNNRYLQLGTMNLGRVENNTPVISGYRYDGSVYLSQAVFQNAGDTTAIDQTSALNTTASQMINGVTVDVDSTVAATNPVRNLITETNLTAAEKAEVKDAVASPASAWRYRMNETQQLRLRAQHYIAYTGTNATTQRTITEVDAIRRAVSLNFITVEITDPTIAVLNQDANGDWVIRSANRNEYGTTSVVFKAYEGVRDYTGKPMLMDGSVDNGSMTEAEIIAAGGYKHQCVAESVMQVEVYPATGVATPMVVSGANHTLALKADGTVWAWGSNMMGQLGIATSVNKDNWYNHGDCCDCHESSHSSFWTTMY
ncbi:MAG: hypothetical protein NC311_14950, partial [Muribaculaceae bacterium]|nr:hypothetical protein [Muribaculaceae bacterium]